MIKAKQYILILLLLALALPARAACTPDPDNPLHYNCHVDEGDSDMYEELDGQSLQKTGLGVLLFDSTNQYNGTLNILEGGAVAGAGALVGDINVAEGEDNFISFEDDSHSAYHGNISGGGDLSKSGAGTMTLGGSNTISNTFIYEGALKITDGQNLQGRISTMGGELVTEGDVTLGAYGAQHLSFDNDDLDTQKGLNVDGTLTLNQNVTLGGAAGLVKDGLGTLILEHDFSSDNYYGGTVIKSGTVQIKDGGALGSSGSVVSIESAELYITENTSIDREIEAVLGHNAGLNVEDTKAVSLLKNTSGEGALVKTGMGTLNIFDAQMAHSGGTIVSEGVLQGSSASLAGDITAAAGSSVNFVQSASGTFAGTLLGGGTFNKYEAGTLTLTGAHSFEGVYNIHAGAIEGHSLSISSDAVISNGAAIIFNQNFDGQFDGNISGAGSLVKTGSGVLKLTDITNDYSGLTVIQDASGILFEDDRVFGSSNIELQGGRISLGSGSVATDRDFVLSDLNNEIYVEDSAQYTINGAISGNSFRKVGLGVLVLDGQNTHNQSTEIREGTLSVYDLSALGTGMLAVTGGTFNSKADMTFGGAVYLSADAGFEADANTTLSLNGFIYGGGTLVKRGAGTLELNGFSNYLGGLRVEDGVLHGDTDSIVGNIAMTGGALHFNQAGEGWFTGDIASLAGSEIHKNGHGTIIMEGNENGSNTLQINSFNVREGGAIMLSRFEGSANISNGAALSLTEHSAGIINAEGEFYVDRAGALNFEGDVNIKSTGSLVLSADEGASSSLNVQNGDINLDAGATLGIMASGVFASPTGFEVAAYSGALSGTFDNVTVLNNARLVAAADYSNQGVISILISRLLSNYAGLGLKYNQSQVAAALDRASAAPNADTESILNDIDAAQNQPAAITQLGGIIYSDIFRLNSFNAARQNAYLRLDTAREGDFLNNIWVQSINNYSQTEENDYSEDMNSLSNGFVFGLDKYYSASNARLGLMASYTREDMKHNSLENLDADEYQLGLYFLLKKDLYDLKTALSFGYRSALVTRDITFLSRKTSARAKSFSLNFDAQADLKLATFGIFELRPFLGIEASGEKRNSFEEEGAGMADISFKGDNIFYSSARGGLSVQKRTGTFNYYADISAEQNIVNPKTELTVMGESYTLKPAGQDVFFGAGLGAAKHFSDLVSIFIDGGAKGNSDTKDYYINLGFRSYF